MTIPGKVIEAGEKVADVAERTTKRAKAIVQEEARFGKEVMKDFVFGPDCEDRRPHHEKPPEPKSPRPPAQARGTPEPTQSPPAPEPDAPSTAKSQREQMMDELRQVRDRASSKDRSRDPGDRGDDR